MRILFLLLIISSCSRNQEPEISDEYVLVEFASKLEEDYHRISGKEDFVPRRDQTQKK